MAEMGKGGEAKLESGADPICRSDSNATLRAPRVEPEISRQKRHREILISALWTYLRMSYTLSVAHAHILHPSSILIGTDDVG